MQFDSSRVKHGLVTSHSNHPPSKRHLILSRPSPLKAIPTTTKPVPSELSQHPPMPNGALQAHPFTSVPASSLAIDFFSPDTHPSFALHRCASSPACCFFRQAEGNNFYCTRSKHSAARKMFHVKRFIRCPEPSQ